MRKILPIAAALVLALAGCSSGAQTTAEDTTPKAEVVEEATAEEEVEEATEEEADQGLIINWVDAASSDEAAKGAGFDKFGVIDKFTIGDMTFENPTFAYAGGVAQAIYDRPACGVIIRKAVDTYSTPLSDRSLDEFAARWFKVIEGTEVTCYGVAKGAVTVATWTDGSKSYALTFQGYGGDEMSMDSDEIATIVKGINEANADQKATEEKKEEKKEETKTEEKPDASKKQNALLSANEAEALAEKTSGGTCTSIDLVTTTKYGQCWLAVCVDKDGTRYEYYINNDDIYLIEKKAAQKDKNSNSSTKSEHYEGEPVTIYDSIYAEWHQANEQWYATFVTFNGTQVFAQKAPAGGGWVFYALVNGKTTQIIYSDQESSVTGQVGPGGVSSHWQELNGNAWF